MERRGFIKRLFGGAVVAAVAPVIIASEEKETIDMSKYIAGVDPYLPEGAGPGLIAQVNTPNYVIYTGLKGKEEFDKVMREYLVRHYSYK